MSKTEQLAEEAEILNKTIFMVCAWTGQPGPKVIIRAGFYRQCPSDLIKQYVDDIQEKIRSPLGTIVDQELTAPQRMQICRWLAGKFDEWEKQSWANLSMGRVHDFESQFGRLALHEVMDCPPYAELLIQGFESVAVRHPEYHLVRDLALAHSLFRDVEAELHSERTAIGKPKESELNQSLARMVILTSFNLLEAFVSGLATAWLMDNPTATQEQVNALGDNSLTLRKRFLKTTRFVTKRSDLFNENAPPLEPLFGELKRRRDSFVHCEPGDKLNKWGYVKETQFHDVPTSAVEKTVDCTEAVICETWKALTGRERPTWFPCRLSDGRFARMDVKLVSESKTQ